MLMLPKAMPKVAAKAGVRPCPVAIPINIATAGPGDNEATNKMA